MRPATFAAKLSSSIAEFAPVATALGEWLSTAGAPAAAARDIRLMLDELFTNIVFHGYGGGTDGWVEVRAAVKGAAVEIVLRDRGTPFDPTQTPDPDRSAPLEQRRIGGLGLYFVRRLADGLSYRRVQTEGDLSVNELRITKYFAHPAR